MNESQFQAEVSRRVGQEMRRIEQNYKAKQARPPEGQVPAPTPSRTEAIPPAEGSAATLEGGAAPPSPTASPESTPPPARPASAAPPDAIDTPPKIQSVVKPVYPPFALRARVGGVVILRVLISETGLPLDVVVVQGVGGGLTEAAVDAVKRWKFQPGRRSGAAVRTWTTIPIPFEP